MARSLDVARSLDMARRLSARRDSPPRPRFRWFWCRATQSNHLGRRASRCDLEGNAKFRKITRRKSCFWRAMNHPACMACPGCPVAQRSQLESLPTTLRGTGRARLLVRGSAACAPSRDGCNWSSWGKMKVDVDNSATEDDHRVCIEQSGEAYLIAALDVSRPPDTRGRALTAAVEHLCEQARAAPVTATQGTQRAVPRGTKLGSVVAACIDVDVPVAALLYAADASSEALLLPVLEKVLCLIAGIAALRGAGSGAGSDDDDPDSDGSADDAEEPGVQSGGASESDSEAGSVGTSGKRKKKHRGRPQSLVKNRRTSGQARTRSISAECSGQAYVDDYVTRLSAPATQQTPPRRRGDDDVFVARIAREAPLSKETVLVVMENLLHRLRTCDVFELPAFIYQLLLLVSSRGTPVTKRNVLRAIVTHFADLEEAAEASALEASHTQRADVDDIIQSVVTNTVLRQIQSTTLLHIDFAVKQDPGLVSELTKLARAPADSPHSIMVPFGMAVLLALSRTPSAQVSVLSTIRDAVLSYDREMLLRKRNAFAARVCRNDTEPVRNPRAALRRAVESTAKDGWDLVCEPLLHLGLLLIGKCSTSWSVTASLSGHPAETEAELGADMLIELFLAHTALRTEIVDQLVSHIVLRAKCSPLAVDLLHRLARRSPSDLLQCSSKVKESITELVTLPPWTSCALISAYKPLLRARPDLLDYLFLALRKALFHREPCARAVASTGFLTVLAAPDDNLSLGRLGRSQASAPSDADSLEDAIQPLRRALSFPPAIRALVYKEMRRSVKAIIGPHGAMVCKSILHLLQPHLLRFVDASQAPFLLLSHCVNESAGGRLVEPLGDLIACFADVQNALDPAAFSSGAVIHLAKSVATVCVRDFDVSKTLRSGGENAEASDVDDDEERANVAADTANRNRARVLGSVVEALLHSALSAQSSLHDTSFYTTVVFPLLQIREDVLVVLKELGALSASDAVRDLGGNVDIEPGAGRSIGWFGGNSKGGSGAGGGKGKVGKGGGKTNDGKNKSKKNSDGGSGDVGHGSGSSGTSDVGNRFGAFGILASSASCPLVSLNAAVTCLASMHSIDCSDGNDNKEETGEEETEASPLAQERPISSWFSKNIMHKDTERLSLYLRSVAKAHVDHAIDEAKQSLSQSFSSLRYERKDLASSLCTLIHVAMADFQQHRAQTGVAHTKAAVRSLELVETCISAVSIVHLADWAVANRLCASLLRSSTGRRAGSRAASGNAEPSAIVSSIRGLETMYESLVEDELVREAEVVVRILVALGALYGDSELTLKKRGTGDTLSSVEVCADMASWARSVLECRRGRGEKEGGSVVTSGEGGMTRGLVLLALGERETDAGLSAAIILSKRAHAVLGHVLDDGMHGEGNDAVFEGAYAFLDSANVFFAIDVVLDVVSGAFDDVEWCLGRMSSLEAAAVMARSNLNGTGTASPRKITQAVATNAEQTELLERRVLRAEDRANRRLTKVVEILMELLTSSIAKSGIQERLFRMATRCYKILSTAVQAQARRRQTDPRTTFLEMITLGKGLTPRVWDYAPLLTSGAGVGGRGGKAAQAMAAKEARIVPQLVYEIERFEKLLIAAQKRTKIELLRGLMRNQARDVKIDAAEDKENESDGDGGGANGSGRPLSVGGLLRRAQ